MLNKKIYKSVAAITVLFIIMANAQSIMLYVKNALLICYNNIIPSLYIFMVFSSYVSQSDFISILYYPLCWYSRLMKIQDKKFSAYLLLSLIGGFAVGASFLKELENRGYEKGCLKAISPAMINNSLSFCVFTVGIGLLDNFYVGLLLFCALTCASMITGFILSFAHEYNIVLSSSANKVKKVSFVDCVNNAVKNILSICGFVIIFYCICEVISLYTQFELLKILVAMCLEVTGACVRILNISGKNPHFMCLALSLIPVSTLCQVHYFTGDSEIIRTLMLSRLIHTPVSLLIFSILANLFPVAANVINPQSIVIKSFSNTMEISATLFLITLCFILIFDSNKLFTKQTN